MTPIDVMRDRLQAAQEKLERVLGAARERLEGVQKQREQVRLGVRAATWVAELHALDADIRDVEAEILRLAGARPALARIEELLDEHAQLEQELRRLARTEGLDTRDEGRACLTGVHSRVLALELELGDAERRGSRTVSEVRRALEAARAERNRALDYLAAVGAPDAARTELEAAWEAFATEFAGLVGGA